MKGGALVILVGLGLSACVTNRSYPVHVFRGGNLEQLLQAGRACGYAEMQMELETPHATGMVSVEIPARRDPRYDCFMQWIRDHPEAGFSAPAPRRHAGARE